VRSTLELLPDFDFMKESFIGHQLTQGQLNRVASGEPEEVPLFGVDQVGHQCPPPLPPAIAQYVLNWVRRR
jgi:hypothetical protein